MTKENSDTGKHPLELKESIKSSMTPKKGENDSSVVYGNSSTLQAEDEKVDPMTNTKEEEETDMWISSNAVVAYSHPYKGVYYVTGYYEKQPLKVLVANGSTTHNFIDESLADKLSIDSYPIKPRIVNSTIGKMVTSRACKNFQLSVEDVVFTVELYLLPLSSNCDIVLGDQWMWSYP